MSGRMMSMSLSTLRPQRDFPIKPTRIAMNDPREVAWQHRREVHSRRNAVRVGFDAAYTQAIPNAHRAHLYNAKFHSVLEWAMRKEIQPAYGVAEEEAAQDQMMNIVAPETVDPETKGNAKSKRNSPARITKAAPVRKSKTELEKLLRARGLSPGAFIAEDSAGSAHVSGGDVLGEGPSIPIPPFDPVTAAPVESSSAEPPVARTTKKSKAKSAPLPISVNKRVSLRARANVPSSSENVYAGSKSSKTAVTTTTFRNTDGGGDGGRDRSLEASDHSLPHIPGTTEVIFDRYPALRRAASTKRGKKRRSNGGRDARKMPGMDVLVFLSRKASDNGQSRPMKAGPENGVAGGSGGLVFLRRNAARAGTRVGGV